MRQVVGESVSPRDLIKLSNLILDTYLSEGKSEEDILGRSRVINIAELDLVAAYQDEGWRVLDFERNRSKNLDDFDEDKLLVLRRKVSKFMGQEWRQDIRTG